MSHNGRAIVQVSPSAPLLLALFVMLSSPLLLAALLLAALGHELGHYAALRRLRGHVTAIRVTALGAEMQVSGRLSYGGELLAAMAGPAANLILALLLACAGRFWDTLYLFAGAQLVLGAFNLLPILPLDGGSMLWTLLAWLTEPYTADRITRRTGFCIAAALMLAAVIMLRMGGSPFLMLAAAGIFWHVVRGGELRVAKPAKKG